MVFERLRVRNTDWNFRIWRWMCLRFKEKLSPYSVFSVTLRLLATQDFVNSRKMGAKSVLATDTFRMVDRGIIKEAKICAVCQRPFTWRKKWQSNWNEVKVCSDACKRKKKSVPKKPETRWSWKTFQFCVQDSTTVVGHNFRRTGR